MVGVVAGMLWQRVRVPPTFVLLAPSTYFGEALPADGIAQLVQQTTFPG